MRSGCFSALNRKAGSVCSHNLFYAFNFTSVYKFQLKFKMQLCALYQSRRHCFLLWRPVLCCDTSQEQLVTCLSSGTIWGCFSYCLSSCIALSACYGFVKSFKKFQSKIENYLNLMDISCGGRPWIVSRKASWRRKIVGWAWGDCLWRCQHYWELLDRRRTCRALGSWVLHGRLFGYEKPDKNMKFVWNKAQSCQRNRVLVVRNAVTSTSRL